MQIFVKPYDRTLTLDVRPTDMVIIVQGMIEFQTPNLNFPEDAIPSYKMCLSYAGKPLDDERTL